MDGLIEATIDSLDWGEGYWQVTIDPTLSYMVREARYFWEKSQIAYFEMSNSGLIETKGGAFVPNQAVWRENSSPPMPARELPFTFEEPVLKPDDEFLAEAQSTLKIEEAQDMLTELFDHRVNPTVSFYRRPGEQTRVRPLGRGGLPSIDPRTLSVDCSVVR